MAQSASTQLVIRIHKKGEIFGDKAAVDDVFKKTDIRDLEIKILENCFQLKALETKDIKVSNVCRDCMGSLRNLADEETEILFTKEDINNLREGFGLSAGAGRFGRPTVWLECVDLMKQIENPDEYKEQKS